MLSQFLSRAQAPAWALPRLWWPDPATRHPQVDSGEVIFFYKLKQLHDLFVHCKAQHQISFTTWMSDSWLQEEDTLSAIYLSIYNFFLQSQYLITLLPRLIFNLCWYPPRDCCCVIWLGRGLARPQLGLWRLNHVMVRTRWWRTMTVNCSHCTVPVHVPYLHHFLWGGMLPYHSSWACDKICCLQITKRSWLGQAEPLQ